MALRILAVGAVLAGIVAVSAARADVGRESLVPGGVTRMLRVQAEGVQLYECATAAGGGAAWRFREPLATLMVDGKTVGRHFAGPAWEMNDGSLVRGRVVAQAAGERAGDIPWLRLDVAGRERPGMLAAMTGVARIETRGGAFEGACPTVGALHLEPYSAAYVFWGND